MNFLAHLYLSENNKNLIIGNFIADAVKGIQYQNYPIEIQFGILLHREIDTFTDFHPIVKRSKHRLNTQYNHYKGIIIDIFYDHFLAKNWKEYSAIPLDIYAQSIYKLLNDNKEYFPESIKKMYPYMIQYDWLTNYQSNDGIETILKGMGNRLKKSKIEMSIEDLILHYSDFEKDFTEYFIELKAFTKNKANSYYEKS